MLLYLAGPMSGVPDYNYPAFDEYERYWTAKGWAVINPARRFNRRTDLPYDVYINHSMLDVMTCDVVAVLPGWENSRGATLEVYYAQVAGKPVVRAEHFARSLAGCVRAEAIELRPPASELPANRGLVVCDCGHNYNAPADGLDDACCKNCPAYGNA